MPRLVFWGVHRRVAESGEGYIVRRRTTIREYAAVYALWLLLIALGYLVVAVVWRSAIQALVVALVDETDVDARFRGGAFYFFGITLILLGLFAMIMAGEPYLRQGAERGQLRRRFLRLAVPLAALGVLGVLVRIGAGLAQ